MEPRFPKHGSEDRRNGRKRSRGGALIEVTFLVPWIFFVFVGILDVGFYTYGLIAVENAARVAATYTSQGPSLADDQVHACGLVRTELENLPNAGAMSTTCNAAPLIVTATALPNGPDGNPATSVSVTYRTNNLIPIPGVMMGRLDITRNVQMRVKP